MLLYVGLQTQGLSRTQRYVLLIVILEQSDHVRSLWWAPDGRLTQANSRNVFEIIVLCVGLQTRRLSHTQVGIVLGRDV